MVPVTRADPEALHAKRYADAWSNVDPHVLEERAGGSGGGMGSNTLVHLEVA